MILFINREKGETGEVFALLFNNNAGDERDLLYRICVGSGITVVNAQLQGEWCEMRIIWSPEPCLDGVSLNAFVPNSLPECVS
jgi:hypothetical protein